MKGSAKKCGIVGDMLVSVAAVMGTVHLVLRFASWIFFFFLLMLMFRKSMEMYVTYAMADL